MSTPLWLLVVVAVGFYAYGVGEGIGGTRAARQCSADVREIVAAGDRALARCREARSEPPLPPFTGPPMPLPPVVECFAGDRARCCFRQHHDAQLGFYSYEPLGCVPTCKG